jgi:hypothetical protein
MMISIFPTILLIIATVAIGYLAYDIVHTHSDPNEIIVGVGTGISILMTLGCLLGLSLKDSRLNINMKAWSGVAFVVMAVVNLCYAGFGVSMPLCYRHCFTFGYPPLGSI